MNTKDFEVTKDLQLNSITHGKVSLEEAVKYIVDYLSADKQAKYEIAIGTKGATAEFISELEGWVTAYSFKYKIKPESYASSTIADKLSK